MALKDSDLMPQRGKYAGIPMEKVPFSYLFWLEEQPHCMKSVREYIDENRSVLEHEEKQYLRNKK